MESESVVHLGMIFFLREHLVVWRYAHVHQAREGHTTTCGNVGRY